MKLKHGLRMLLISALVSGSSHARNHLGSRSPGQVL